jgi:cytidylate kinase
VFLDAALQARIERTIKHGTAGELAELTTSVQEADRELAPVVSWFRKLGKSVTVDTSAMTPEEVFEAATPFLE